MSKLTEYDFDVQQKLIEKNRDEIMALKRTIACILTELREVRISRQTACTVNDKSVIEQWEHPNGDIILKIKEVK